ncbi:ChaN family lipoprotein [Vibrio europaeus]|uniref:ChaN family lipoprotein n=1 Tax=Vibrio europaeus TaxID=300876 RepID=UPI0023415A1E|nr:ChaN family lipoprotein [Vibrio europaeus]MDC5848092.1 ChaN family lipoprotein [Vibrio europaeus]
MFRLIATSLSCFALAACSSSPLSSEQQTISSYYDYQLYTPEKQLISIDSLPEPLKTADVILVGEWHTHAGVHRFQVDLLKQLVSQGKDVALSMEQFSRDKQSVVDSYLASEIGEQVLIKQGAAWPNYESDYRPLVEFAKANQLDVIAANAPKPIVRCLGRQGVGYLDKLASSERQQLAATIDTSNSAYKEKFMASMHHGKPEQTERQFAAQVTWDETMAESIVNYLASNPSKQVIHIAGKFHTEQGFGTKASILKRNPNLNVVVITPTDLPVELEGQDYPLEVLAPPVRYVKIENRMAAYKHLSKRNDDLECK